MRRPLALFIALAFLASCGKHSKKLSSNTGGSVWTVEVLDNGIRPLPDRLLQDASGRYVSAAFDGFGNIHAAFMSQGRVGYLYGRVSNMGESQDGDGIAKRRLPRGWRYEAIPIVPIDKSEGILLTVDPQGRPHVFYVSARGLEHAVLTASGWAVGRVTARVAPLSTWSLAMTPSGAPVVAFKEPDGKFVVLQPTLSGWQEHRVDRPSSDPGGPIHCLSLRVGSDGLARLTYLSQLNNLATVWFAGEVPSVKATNPAMKDEPALEWSLPESVFSWAERPISVCRADMDGERLPHLAYLGWPEDHWDGTEFMAYVSRQDQKWRKKTLIKAAPSTGAKTALAFAVTPSGTPHIVYNAGEKGMQYWTKEKDKWTPTLLDQTVDVNGEPVLLLDAKGNPWVLYIDAERAQLKLARKQPAYSNF